MTSDETSDRFLVPMLRLYRYDRQLVCNRALTQRLMDKSHDAMVDGEGSRVDGEGGTDLEAIQLRISTPCRAMLCAWKHYLVHS